MPAHYGWGGLGINITGGTITGGRSLEPGLGSVMLCLRRYCGRGMDGDPANDRGDTWMTKANGSPYLSHNSSSCASVLASLC